MEEKELRKPLTSTEQELQDFSNRVDNNLDNNLDLPLNIKTKKLSPYYTSNFLGKFFFNWTRYAMSMANKSPLKIVDFKGLAEKDQSQNWLSKFVCSQVGTLS